MRGIKHLKQNRICEKSSISRKIKKTKEKQDKKENEEFRQYMKMISNKNLMLSSKINDI